MYKLRFDGLFDDIDAFSWGRIDDAQFWRGLSSIERKVYQYPEHFLTLLSREFGGYAAGLLRKHDIEYIGGGNAKYISPKSRIAGLSRIVAYRKLRAILAD